MSHQITAIQFTQDMAEGSSPLPLGVKVTEFPSIGLKIHTVWTDTGNQRIKVGQWVMCNQGVYSIRDSVMKVG